MNAKIPGDLPNLPDDTLSILLSHAAGEVERSTRLIRAAQDRLSATEARWAELHAEQQRRIGEGRYGPYTVVGGELRAQAEREGGGRLKPAERRLKGEGS